MIAVYIIIGIMLVAGFACCYFACIIRHENRQAGGHTQGGK